MPFAPIWGGRRVGGRINRPMPTGGRVNTAPQHNPKLNPRSAAPARPDSFLPSGKVINTESMALGASANQGQAWNLPTLGDITGLQFGLSASSATGSGSLTVDWANAIDHIVVRNKNGTPFDTIYFSDPALAGGLKCRIYDWDTLFIEPTPTSVRSNTTAASTALTGITKTITVPGLRMSAEDGPWQLEVWYSSTTEFGGTGVTAATISNRIRVKYGTTDDGTGQKWNTKFAQQTIPTTGTGDFHLETSGIVKNTLINHVLVQRVATLTDFDHAVVNSRGQNIDTNLSEAEIVQAMTDSYNNAFLTTTLCPTAALNNQFTIGDNDEFILNFGTSESNVIVAYQYLLPAGDSY